MHTHRHTHKRTPLRQARLCLVPLPLPTRRAHLTPHRHRLRFFHAFPLPHTYSPSTGTAPHRTAQHTGLPPPSLSPPLVCPIFLYNVLSCSPESILSTSAPAPCCHQTTCLLQPPSLPLASTVMPPPLPTLLFLLIAWVEVSPWRRIPPSPLLLLASALFDRAHSSSASPSPFCAFKLPIPLFPPRCIASQPAERAHTHTQVPR